MDAVREQDIARLRSLGATVDVAGKHVQVRTPSGQMVAFHQGSREIPREVHRLRRVMRLLERRGASEPPAPVPCRCAACGEPLPSAADLMEHQRECRPPLPAPVAAAREPEAPPPRCAVPGCEHRAVTRTGLCDESHGAVTQWADRRGLLHGPEDALTAWQLWREAQAIPGYACRHCGEVYPSPAALGLHVLRAHPEESRRRRIPVDKPRETPAEAPPRPTSVTAAREAIAKRLADLDAEAVRLRADLATLDAAAEVLARVGGGAA